jgi:hypothetical protein
MAAPIEAKPTISFEGYTPGTEIWGGTQANFLIQLPGPDKECAVLLNGPAAAALAEASGNDNTPEFREAAARAFGEALLPGLVASGRQVDSLIVVSRGMLEDHPAVRDSAIAALKR